MTDIELMKQQIKSSIKRVERPAKAFVMSKPINAQTITKALKEHSYVEIPNIGEPIVLDEPIIISSNQHLLVDPEQILMQAPECYTCLIRNEHIQDGAFHDTDHTIRDKNLSVTGGTWHIHRDVKCYTDKEKSMQGSLSATIFCGVEQIELRDMRIFDSELCGPRQNGPASYGIQLCDCKDFVVENIDFYSNHRDGLHINGPASNGYVKHLRGDKMGDDLLAVNAWDWDTSAITFGTIEKMIVEDVKGAGNELRLLPGAKIYKEGNVQCDIIDCVFENMSGIYTYKLYGQPNIANVYTHKNDVSGDIGNIKNVYFKNISFPLLSNTGFNDLPVKSLFEICSDVDGLHIEDVNVENTIDQCDNMDLRLINVGPLSATWKTNGSEDPADWGEVFDPDAICTADNIYLSNITFAGEQIKDASKLTREVKMTINPDYPKTTPKGGTGYGTIKNVYVK